MVKCQSFVWSPIPATSLTTVKLPWGAGVLLVKTTVALSPKLSVWSPVSYVAASISNPNFSLLTSISVINPLLSVSAILYVVPGFKPVITRDSPLASSASSTLLSICSVMSISAASLLAALITALKRRLSFLPIALYSSLNVRVKGYFCVSLISSKGSTTNFFNVNDTVGVLVTVKTKVPSSFCVISLS